jgi:hypothetical protein
MRIAQVLPVVSGDIQLLGIDMQSEIDYNQGLVIGLDINYALPSTYYGLLYGYNSSSLTAFYVRVYLQTLVDVLLYYTDSTSTTVNIGVSLGQLPKKAIFYFRQSGSTLNVVTYIDGQRKVSSGQLSENKTLRLSRYIVTSSNLVLLSKSSILIVDTGIKTDDELMNYFDLLNSLNCDSQKALDLVNAVVPKTEPKDLFNAVVGYLTDFGGQDPQDIIALLRSMIGAVYPITAGPIPETRASGVMVGVYEQGPTTITEKGPLLEFSSSVAIEVQAPDDAQLFEVLDFIEQTINFLNWKTPASITQRRVWHQNETDINKAYAFCVGQIKTYKWR